MSPKFSVLILLVAIVCCTLTIVSSEVTTKIVHSVEKIGLGVLNGPESIVWDAQGNIYTSVSDGTIRMINATTQEISIYSYSAQNLTPEERALCGTSVVHEPKCGRALGLQFDAEENLWIADAYKGILKVSRQDPSIVETIVNNYNGVPFKMANSLYLTEDGSTLYFTDTSQVYTRMQFVSIVVANAPDGRLFKLNLETNELTVEISDLRFANGIAVGLDEKFLLINECSARSIRKYYLTGSRAGQNAVLVKDIGGYNDNIRPDGLGNFYVGLFSYTSEEMSAILTYPDLQTLALQYVPPLNILGLIDTFGLIKKIDSFGRVVEVIQSANSTVFSRTAEADVHDGYLYIGSVLNNYLGRVALSDLEVIEN